MKTLKNLLKENKLQSILLAPALLIWILTFITDKKTFYKDALDMNCLPIDTQMVPLMHLFTKVILFFVIYGLFIFASYALKNKRVLIIFISLMVIYMVGLLITYPGYFMSDDPIIWAYASRYYPVYWHCYLTSLYYMVGMSLIPASCGPVVLSDICYALVFTYIYEMSCRHFSEKIKHLTLILGILPFSLLGALMCFRPALYAPVFLFLVAFLFFEQKKKAEFTYAKLIFIAALTAVLCIWRSEGIVLLVFIFMILPFVYARSFCNKKKILLFLLCLLAFFGVIKAPQSRGEKLFYGSDYLIISTTRPLSVIVHRDQTYEGAKEDLANVSAITEFGYLHNDSLSCSAYNRYNSDHNQGKYTETGADREMQKAYLKSAFRLIAHNLDLYLGERLQLFCVTNGIFNYPKDMVLNLKPVVTTDFPLYEHDRSYGFTIIDGNKRLHLKGVETYALFLYSFGGEAYIPVLILLILMTIYTLVQKEYMIFFISLSMLAREGVIFLTAPASFIQYSYPVMFATVFLALALLIQTLDVAKQNRI